MVRFVWVLVVWWLVMPGAALAAPGGDVLELRSDWYRIVRPYRYDEARRFESGWHRGADVLVAGEQVRAPVAGTVRFAGSVAGQNVLTLDAVLHGRAVRVAFTGVRELAAAKGDSIGAGAVIGEGSSMHVGVYDAQRRERYLPVVARAVGAGGAPPARSAHPLAGGIVGRLIEAVSGRVTLAGVDVRMQPSAAGALHGGDAPAVPGAMPATMPPGTLLAREAVASSSRVLMPRHRLVRRATRRLLPIGMGGAQLQTGAALAVRQAEPGRGSMRHETSVQRVPALDAFNTPGARSIVAEKWAPRQGWRAGAAPRVGRPASHGPRGERASGSAAHRRTLAAPLRRRAASGIATVLLLLAAWLLQGRARGARTRILHVHGSPAAAPAAIAIGSTHELLRHDTDLLRQRDAPPRARLHDDRSRRDHAVSAAHGS